MARTGATTRPRTLWEEGQERGRNVVVLGLALALSAVSLDLVLSGELTMFFGLAFIASCGVLALVVRPEDFFTVGVLPPLLLVAVFVLLGVLRPGTVGAADDRVIQAVFSGLATHSATLVSGYALCLLLLAIRHRVLSRQFA